MSFANTSDAAQANRNEDNGAILTDVQEKKTTGSEGSEGGW